MNCKHRYSLLPFRIVLSLCLCALQSACGTLFNFGSAPLFVTPITIEGKSIGSAIIDTGGRYDLVLRSDFGLRIVDSADILAFNGREQISLTESFQYEAGGIPSRAETAIVGISICDCNGLGYFFFRKTGTVLGLDFNRLQAEFHTTVPAGGVTIPFAPPPRQLGNFDSSFIEVELSAGDKRQTVIGILDTGTSGTVMRFGALTTRPIQFTNRVDIQITHPLLGTVAARVVLFDTPGLPDIIIGTDVMRAWSDRWFFQYLPKGGTITVFLPENPSELPQRPAPIEGIPLFQPIEFKDK